MHLITELNTEQINAALISIRNELKKEVVFETGAEFHIADNNNYVVGGLLTSSATEIKFSVVLPKIIETQSVKVTELKANIRNAGSCIPAIGYVSGGYNFLKNYKVDAVKITDNTVCFTITNPSRFNTTNNSALAIELNRLTLQFK